MRPRAPRRRGEEGRHGRPLAPQSSGVVLHPVRVRHARRGGGLAQHTLQGARAGVHPRAVRGDHPRPDRPPRARGLSRHAARGPSRALRSRARRPRGGEPSTSQADHRGLRGSSSRLSRAPRPERDRGERHVATARGRCREGGGPGRSVDDPLHVRHHLVPEGRADQPPKCRPSRLVRGQGARRHGDRPRFARPAPVRHLGRPLHPALHLRPRRLPRAHGDVRPRGGPAPDRARRDHDLERGGRHGHRGTRSPGPVPPQALDPSHGGLRHDGGRP